MIKKSPLKTEVLYITYDGLLEPIGQSQILKYIVHLSDDHNFTILSLEKESDLAEEKKLHQCNAILKQSRVKMEV